MPKFRQWKKQRLEECMDFSRKGGIDDDIADLVKIINDSGDYFTTSSCSGRVVCYAEASGLLSACCPGWLTYMYTSPRPPCAEYMLQHTRPC